MTGASRTMKFLVAALALFAFTLASSQERPVEKATRVSKVDDKKGQSGSKGYETKPANQLPRPQVAADATNSPTDVEQPIAHTKSDGEQENEKKEEGLWAKLFADPVAVFTCLLFFATLALWWATRKLVLGAEDTARRQLRAYVTVPIVTIQDEKRQNGIAKSFIHITIRNFGQTPAKHCSYWLDICSHQLPLTSSLAKPELAKDSGIGIIAPTDTFTVRTEFPLLPNDYEIYAGRYAMYVHGQFHYTDAFGTRQTTEFRFMRNGEGWTGDGEMEVCADGNDAT